MAEKDGRGRHLDKGAVFIMIKHHQFFFSIGATKFSFFFLRGWGNLFVNMNIMLWGPGSGARLFFFSILILWFQFFP